MMSNSLTQQITDISPHAGVYIMKDASGQILYIGKAQNLKKRLASYFNGPQAPKTHALVQKITTIETILTATENEALILESNLIKRHRPRYNVILKDDKRYPCLRLDIKHPYPRISVVRKIKNDGARYFGPFSSTGAVRQTLKIINKTFKLRKCSSEKLKNRSRPCLNYQIDACLGPCCYDVSQEVYQEIVHEVILFLNGKINDLLKQIKAQMKHAATHQEFEKAAQLRDKMFAIKRTVEKQAIVTPDLINRDIVGIAMAEKRSVITLLFVRGGYLVGSRHYEFFETIATEPEIIEAFIQQYYETDPFLPTEILVGHPLSDATLLEQWLYSTTAKMIPVHHPKRGSKVQLVKMADENAKNHLQKLITAAKTGQDLMQRLQKQLGMSELPEHIECIDNSNTFGTTPVAGIVAFKGTTPDTSMYRKFNIRTVVGADDYATMYEVLKRRYAKQDLPLPDVLMVDGGKGQLNIAVAVAKELNLYDRFRIISIAKKNPEKGELEDKIYLPERSNPLNMNQDKDLLHFLMQIRDEAHRYAISFHRQKRGKKSLHSVFDDIPGIGKKRKTILLHHFKSIENIRSADPEILRQLPGMNRRAADAVQSYFKSEAHD